MNLDKNRITPARIAATYIGTVIGAGFASGQEIMQFFTVFGIFGIFTLILSGLIFSLLAYAIFQLSQYFHTNNYKDFIYKLCGPRLGFIYDILLSVFLFLGTSIMFSGSGAIFEENLHLPKLIGVLFIAMLTLFIVWQSLNGILRINAVIVPVMLTVIVAVLAASLLNPALQESFTIKNHFTDLPKAFFFLLYYCSYNSALSLGVLCAFSGKTTNSKVLLKGAFMGGIGLMLLGLALNLCLLLYVPDIFHYSIPMLHVIHTFNPIFKYLVMLCIWCEIFSTAVANLFSLSCRISRSQPGLYKTICILLTFACLPLSLMNFKHLVAMLYPVFGALSLLLILLIFISFIRNRRLIRYNSK